MTRSNRITAATATILAGFLTATAQADPRIVNGLSTQDFPSTGALLYSGGGAITSTNAFIQCTGTLIGCRTFLTAGHCVVSDSIASHYWVYLQNGGILPVSTVTHHPDYVRGSSSHDVAVLKLAEPVTGIEPTPINTSHDLDALGTGLGGTIAGFGRSGGGADYGLKRYGAVATADCNLEATGGEGNDVLVCWNYDEAVGAAGTDSNTCNGDSGGPLFMDFDGRTEVVGVTSAGTNYSCGPGDHSWDASVYANAAWITSQIAYDPTTACGDLPVVGDEKVTTSQDSGILSTSNTSDTIEVTLTGSPALVRFTLNGTDDGIFNPNFFVKQGSGADAANYDCHSDGLTAFGACEFANPAPGTWSVFVQRASGSGHYQLTTTVFGSDPAICGDGAATGTEACDGADDDACPGACQPDCSCPAPVCGDGVASGTERCDGADDSKCPGACLDDCNCPQTCSRGPLYFFTFLSDAQQFAYKGALYDPMAVLDDLDPRHSALELSVTDGAGQVSLSIPANDAGWRKADTVRHNFVWKGDGSMDGLKSVKMQYKGSAIPPYWLVTVRGKAVPGAGDINVQQSLDFRLGFDGTCHLETW